MKLIIDIPDEEYKTLSKLPEKEKVNELSYYERVIANGISYEERPHGEWIGNAFDEHHCSRCGHPALWEEEPDDYYEVQSRFCPNCGACMQKEEFQ
jgi:hypothetical protein